MTAALGLGTYRVAGIAEAARYAVASGARWVDTAPNYADGQAQQALRSVLADRPEVRVSTKVGFLTRKGPAQALAAGVVTEDRPRHGLSADLVRWQTALNCEYLGRPRLDCQLLHNPEHATADRLLLHRRMREAFEALEQEAANGTITGYGVATWTGFSNGAFTIAELLDLATEAAGSTDHHLTTVQLPVSLVMIDPLAAAAAGNGPVVEAADAGLHVMASAPLHGGDLADMVTPDLAQLIAPGLTPAQSALLAVASTPGLTTVLLSASRTAHWDEARAALARPPLTAPQLRELTDALTTT